MFKFGVSVFSSSADAAITMCRLNLAVGPSINDVRRERRGFGHMRTGGGVKDLADVRKLVLYILFQLALQSCRYSLIVMHKYNVYDLCHRV